MITDKGRGVSPTVIYLVLTVLFCSVPYMVIAYTQQLRGANGGYVIALMWGPATAAFVTIWWKKLDWSTLGFAWRDTPAAWLGYLVPIAYVAVAYGVIWGLGLGGFAQPENIAAMAAGLGWTATDPATFVPLYVLLVGTTGIVPGTARALGEELGWRGFLAPRLHARFGYTGGTLVTGVIWTLWHVPLIVFSNYNNGTPSVFALTCFFLMVMNVSFIMSWLRLRSGSVWPCAILHGSHNLFIQQIFTPLTSAHGNMTAYAIDEFGFMIPATTFVVALLCWLNRDRAVAADAARRRRG